MPTYIQSKITNKGPGAKFEFTANSMEDAVQELKDVIPSKRSFHNAVAFVMINKDGGEEPVTLTRGTDF